MKTFKRVMLCVLLISALLIGFRSTSHASFELTIVDPSTGDFITLDQTGALIASSGAGTYLQTGLVDANGYISWSGSLGAVGSSYDWTFTVTTAQTYSALGTPSAPQMDIDFGGKANTAGLTLNIFASGTGYINPPSGSAGLAELSIGGTTTPSNTVTEVLFGGNSNTLFDETQTIASLTPIIAASGTTNVAFSGASNTGFTQISGTSAYSLTEEVILNANNAGTTTLDAAVAIPEPVSILFLGLTLLGGGIYGRLRKKNNA